jgi:hypothetical protein
MLACKCKSLRSSSPSSASCMQKKTLSEYNVCKVMLRWGVAVGS